MKIKFILVVIAVALAGLALAEQLQEAFLVMREVDAGLALFCLIGLVGYQLLNSCLWRDVLFSMGRKVSRYASARVWIESESLKWLPGGVWSYGSRVILAKQLGVKKTEAAMSMLWEVMLTNISWAILAASVVFSPSLLSVFSEWLKTLHLGGVGVLMVGTVSALILLAGAFYIFRAKAVNVLKSLSVVRQVNGRISTLVVAKYTLLNTLNLSLFFTLCMAVPGVEITWLDAVAVGALSWLVGFWAIGVPGGIGVREAFMVILLSSFMQIEIAMAVAILWRVIQMLSEIIGVVLVMSTRSNKHYTKGGKHYETI